MIDMGTFEGHTRSGIRAMNSAGWAVGHSGKTYFSTAVLWREGTVTSLGLGGRGSIEGPLITSTAVDVNENGLVAAYRTRFENSDAVSPSGASAWLWKNGRKVRLPATRARPGAMVFAVNDHGVAVGAVQKTTGAMDTEQRPVLWRRGKAVRLPIPRGLSGAAVENNNFGLVVGFVRRGEDSPLRPWFWRVGGRSGPLEVSGRRSPFGGLPTDVDDRDRIVGTYNDYPVLWRKPRADMKRIGPRSYWPEAINIHGDLAGVYSVDFQGPYPWVGRLGSQPQPLPMPRTDRDRWAHAHDVIRGVTDFAPQGGVSVGGEARYERNRARATIWTCAHQQPHN